MPRRAPAKHENNGPLYHFEERSDEPIPITAYTLPQTQPGETEKEAGKISSKEKVGFPKQAILY